MKNNKLYLAVLYGDFNNLSDEATFKELNKEIVRVLPNPITSLDYLCTCCETSLSGDMKSLCSSCFEYKLKSDSSLEDYLSELHVVFGIDCEFDLSDRSIINYDNKYIQRGIIKSLSRPDELLDPEREIVIDEDMYYYKTL